MEYNRSKKEIEALSHILVENMDFMMSNHDYKTQKGIINRSIEGLELIMDSLTTAHKGGDLVYIECPETYSWLMKSRENIFEQYDETIELMIDRL